MFKTVSPPSEDDFAASLKKKIITHRSRCKRLDLTGVSLLSLGDSERAALVKLIVDEKIQELVLNQNNLGKIMDLKDWQAFCDGLKGSALTTLIIENNELYRFSKAHWEALDALITSLSLKELSLQNNRLYALSPESFQLLATLINKTSFPCLITCNNWENNMDRWREMLDARPKNKSESESRYRFNFGEKTPAGNVGDNNEIPPALEAAAKNPAIMRY